MIPTKVLIIGSGPAGLTAAIYAARAALKPILLHGMQPGGQLTITTEVENYPGFAKSIEGPWLMEQMTEQAKNVGTEIISDYVEKIDLSSRPFVATTGSGNKYSATRATIVYRVHLNLGEEEKAAVVLVNFYFRKHEDDARIIFSLELLEYL